MDTNRTKVLQCIIDLTNAYPKRGAPRALIAKVLGERLSVVDEAVKRLKEDGLIRPVLNGVFVPVAQWPPDRPISGTSLPDGRWRLEVDDHVVEFTPHEAQVLGKMLHGNAMEMASWEQDRVSAEQLVRLEATVRQQAKQITDLMRRQSWKPRRDQPDLFTQPDPPRRRVHAAA